MIANSRPKRTENPKCQGQIRLCGYKAVKKTTIANLCSALSHASAELFNCCLQGGEEEDLNW